VGSAAKHGLKYGTYFVERRTRLTLHNETCDAQTYDDTDWLDHQNTEATMQTIGDRLDQLEAKLDDILEILSADVVFEMDERDLHWVARVTNQGR